MTDALRAVIWAGVSSRPQAEKESLADQVQAGRELAAREGWQVVAVLAVPGMSRSLIDLADAITAVDVELAGEAGAFYRAQLNALGANSPNAYAGLKMLIERRGLDVLVCRGRDRVGRTDSLVSGIEERLWRVGAFLHSRAMPGTGSKIGDIFSSAIERGMARSEIVQFTDKHRAGHDARARAGLPFAHIPFGYRAEWVPDGSRVVRRAAIEPAEAEGYLWAVDAILYQGARLVDVVGRFEALFPERPWEPGPVSEMLRNPFYAGIILRRRKRQPGESDLVQVLDGARDPLWPQVVDVLTARAGRLNFDSVDRATRRPMLHMIGLGAHEPIIGLDLWLELQRLLEGRSESRRPWSGLSIWAGIVRCGLCGAHMGLTRYHYACTVRRRTCGAECANPYIKVTAVTAGVAGYLREMLEREASAPGAQAPARPDLLAGWQRQLVEIESQRERANLLFMSGRIKTTAEYDRHIDRIDRTEAELRAAMAEAREQTERLIAQRDRVELLSELLGDLEGRIAAGEPAEVNRWLRLLFARVSVVGREVTGVVLA